MNIITYEITDKLNLPEIGWFSENVDHKIVRDIFRITRFILPTLEWPQTSTSPEGFIIEQALSKVSDVTSFSLVARIPQTGKSKIDNLRIKNIVTDNPSVNSIDHIESESELFAINLSFLGSDFYKLLAEHAWSALFISTKNSKPISSIQMGEICRLSAPAPPVRGDIERNRPQVLHAALLTRAYSVRILTATPSERSQDDVVDFILL